MPAGAEEALLAWYLKEGRDLPWRRHPRTSYRVLIAEIMLQQTRAEVVAPRYEAFLARFPDFAALAAADPGEVLRYWEGLGYYARGRNLHRLARIVAEAGGDLPRDRQALLALPGVGPYVASAVLAFCHKEPYPALDANVRRVALRFAGSEEPAGIPASDRLAHAVVGDWLREADPAELHDALMDLGAVICTARAPRCAICPLARGCVAREEGRAAELGLRRSSRARTEERLLIARVVSPAGQAWRPRPAQGLLGGMWEPPHVIVQGGALPDLQSLREELQAHWGIRHTSVVGDEDTMRHVFTHRIWTGRIVDLVAPDTDLTAPARWLGRDGLHGVAIPSAFRRAVATELR